jgi:hypothetical protein
LKERERERGREREREEQQNRCERIMNARLMQEKNEHERYRTHIIMDPTIRGMKEAKNPHRPSHPTHV